MNRQVAKTAEFRNERDPNPLGVLGGLAVNLPEVLP